ncbi:MAG: recombinase family protein, partial [Pseudomonadota bacterium]
MLDFGQNHHGLTDAIIYARVSSQAQIKKGQGLESQETYCRQYANYKNYHVHKVFKDSGISGSKADRDGIVAMLKFLKQHKNKRFVCIVDDISRLARDIRVHLDLRDAIDDFEAVLESPAMTFGVDADGRHFENMQALNAMHFRMKNAEQTKKRQQGRMINGYWPFPAVLGYEHKRMEGHGKVMVPKEPMASIIREVLEGFASGRFQTQAEVARHLESQPDFPKTRYGTVTIQAVNRILNRVLYSGYVESKTWNIPLKPAKHKGLITFATYEKIQERLHGKPKIAVRSDVANAFPLRGFVECADCGNPLTACFSKSKTGARHPYYMCHKKGCPSKGKSIRRDKIEEEFRAELAAVQPTKSLSKLARAMLKKAWGILSEHEAATKHAVRQKLLETEQAIEKLLDKIVDAESASVSKAYEKRITKLEREKLVLQEKLDHSAKNRRPFEEM